MRRILLPLLTAGLLLGTGCRFQQTADRRPQTTQPKPTVYGLQSTGTSVASSTRYSDRESYAIALAPKDTAAGAFLTLVRTGNRLRGRTLNLFGKPSGELTGTVGTDGWQSLQWFDDAGGLPLDLRAAWTPDNIWWTTAASADGSQKKIELLPVSRPGSVELTPVTVTRIDTPFQGAKCEFHLTYLQVTGGVPKDKLGALNVLILEALVGTSTEAAPAAVEKMADDYLKECRAELDVPAKELGMENSGALQRYSSQDFSLELNQNGLLSLGFHTDAFYGGAHPLHSSEELTLDLRSGKRLALNDFIAPDKLRAFFQLEKTKLLAERGDVLFEDQKQEFERFTSTIASMTEQEQLDAYGNFSSFYLTPNALVTEYDEYEIAPYAAGPISVFLPYTDIRDLLSPNSPIEQLMQP